MSPLPGLPDLPRAALANLPTPIEPLRRLLPALLPGAAALPELLVKRDDLTGAFNRRAFHGLYEREEERSRAIGLPLSLIYFDLDHFKAVNDEHGHAAGDRVLVSVTDEARALLRAQDLLFRWGGDEFVILLSHTPRADAEQLAEQLRASVAANVGIPGHGGMTMSVGVTSAMPGAVSDADLVRSADAAVYRAKSLGRNRVVAAAAASTTV